MYGAECTTSSLGQMLPAMNNKQQPYSDNQFEKLAHNLTRNDRKQTCTAKWSVTCTVQVVTFPKRFNSCTNQVSLFKSGKGNPRQNDFEHHTLQHVQNLTCWSRMRSWSHLSNLRYPRRDARAARSTTNGIGMSLLLTNISRPWKKRKQYTRIHPWVHSKNLPKPHELQLQPNSMAKSQRNTNTNCEYQWVLSTNLQLLRNIQNTRQPHLIKLVTSLVPICHGLHHQRVNTVTWCLQQSENKAWKGMSKTTFRVNAVYYKTGADGPHLKQGAPWTSNQVGVVLQDLSLIVVCF